MAANLLIGPLEDCTRERHGSATISDVDGTVAMPWYYARIIAAARHMRACGVTSRGGTKELGTQRTIADSLTCLLGHGERKGEVVVMRVCRGVVGLECGRRMGLVGCRNGMAPAAGGEETLPDRCVQATNGSNMVVGECSSGLGWSCGVVDVEKRRRRQEKCGCEGGCRR